MCSENKIRMCYSHEDSEFSRHISIWYFEVFTKPGTWFVRSLLAWEDARNSVSIRTFWSREIEWITVAYIAEHCFRLRKSVNSLCANKNYLCSSWYNCIVYASDEFVYLFLYACYEDRLAVASLVDIVTDLYGCVMCLVDKWAAAAAVAAAPLFALFCITASFNPCLLMITRDVFFCSND